MDTELTYIPELSSQEKDSLQRECFQKAAEIEESLLNVNLNEWYELRDLAVADGDEASLKYFQEFINQHEELIFRKDHFRRIGSGENLIELSSDEIIEIRTKRFDSLFISKNEDPQEKENAVISELDDPEFFAMFKNLRDKIIPFVTDDEITRKIVESFKLFKSLDRETPVNEYNLKQYISSETEFALLGATNFHRWIFEDIEEGFNYRQNTPFRLPQLSEDLDTGKLKFLKLGKDDKSIRKMVNAARLHEVLDALLSRDIPDLHDLDFFNAIASDTKNKFLRNKALQKAVRIAQTPLDLHQHYKISDRSITPSLSTFYESAIKSTNIPKRDFLFLLPLFTHDGSIHNSYLESIMKFTSNESLHKDSEQEAIFYSSIVDLYPTSLSDLVALLEKEYGKINAEQLAQFKDINELRIKDGQAPINYIDFINIHSRFENLLLEEYEPTLLINEESLDAEEFTLKRKEAVDLINECLTEADRNEYWIRASNGFKSSTIKHELTTNTSITDVLRKLSGVKSGLRLQVKYPVDDKEYNRVKSSKKRIESLLSSASSIEEMNDRLDQMQIDVFMETMQISKEELRVLGTNSQKGNIFMSLERSKVEQLYKKLGSFNAIFFLMNRYHEAPPNLNPPIFRNNLVPLLKEAVFHEVQEDFTQWRSEIWTSLQGHANSLYTDKEFQQTRDMWLEDSETILDSETDDQFQSVIYTINRFSRSEANLSFDQFKDSITSPHVWKDPVISRVMNFIRNNNGLLSDAFEQYLHDPEFIKSCGINLKERKIKTRNNDGIEIEVTEQVEVSRLRSFFASIDNVLLLSNQETLSVEDIYMLHESIDQMKIGSYVHKTSKNDVINSLHPLYGVKQLRYLVEAGNTLKKAALRRIGGGMRMIDTSEFHDLLTVGQPSHEIINCMSYEGSPKKTAFVLDILTSKNKKVLLVKNGERVIARAVLKALKTKLPGDIEDREVPVIIVDDVLSVDRGYSFEEEMLIHLRRKFKDVPVIIAKGIPDYNQQNLSKLERVYTENQGNGPIIPSIIKVISTGSRVSAELVETPDPKNNLTGPLEKSEAKNPKDKSKHPSEFYQHLAEVLWVHPSVTPRREIGTGAMTEN